MATVLEARGLNKTFGAVTAASNINVAVEKDSVVGLIGSNGAGKTTFINMVTGYLKPTSGSIEVATGTTRTHRPWLGTTADARTRFELGPLFAEAAGGFFFPIAPERFVYRDAAWRASAALSLSFSGGVTWR